MKTLLTVFTTLLLTGWAGGALAAESWGLPDEEKVRFEAKVVDALCELTGDCPAECGGGKRQLGLLTDSGELILPFKNVVPFAGAAGELREFCGKRVTADGLFAINRGVRVFALQFLREVPGGKWRRANRWTRDWAAANGVAPDSPTASQWFRNDALVKEIIERDGKLGTGK
jgi:hypothetical protein